MKRRSALSILVLLQILTGLHTTAKAEPFMRTSGDHPPPAGHHEFCKKFVSECQVTFDSKAVVTLDIKIWRSLDRINRQVNSSVRRMPDVEEDWSYPKPVADCDIHEYSGDCEDFVLLKRRLLHESGLPLNALLITVVRDHSDTGHAVLTVRTDHGDLILDNMIKTIDTWDKFPYRFLMIQSPFHTGQWLRILPK